MLSSAPFECPSGLLVHAQRHLPLKTAIDTQMNERKTTVIEIMCTQELGDPFRRDALSKPVRYLDKYKKYV